MERRDFSRRCAATGAGDGYHVQLALAGTVGAAWALAHTTALSLVPAGDEEKAISGLPVAALRLPAATLERLEALGLYTIGEVVELPRETLASRFGVILPRRLDQALGLLPETFVCERLKEPLTAFREWEVPIDDRFAVDHRLPAIAARAAVDGRAPWAWVSSSWKGKSRPKRIRSRSRSDWSSPPATNGTSRSSSSCNWSDGHGLEASLRFAGPRLRLGRLEQAQGRWFVDDLESKTSRGVQHPGRATQQPAGGKGRAASRARCRRPARARRPARPVDQRGTTARQTASHYPRNSLAAVPFDF